MTPRRTYVEPPPHSRTRGAHDPVLKRRSAGFDACAVIAGVLALCITVCPTPSASKMKITSDAGLEKPIPKSPQSAASSSHDKPSEGKAPSAANGRDTPGNGTFEGDRAVAAESLAPLVEEETERMLDVVRVLERGDAERWLASFIGGKPWNCPAARVKPFALAIIQAAERNDLPVCKEILALTACILSIESGFRADPLAADPSRGQTMAAQLERAEQQFKEKLGALAQVPPMPQLYASYREKYYPKLMACKTEGDIERLARGLAEELEKETAGMPDLIRNLVQKGVDRLNNLVRTKGSMQLSFNRAKQVVKDRGDRMTDAELSAYMYTVGGGVDVGVAALKPMFIQYAAKYGAPGDLSWLFFVAMDYHYGPFSSRNMMDQIRIRDLSGKKIPLDGDMLQYDDEGKVVGPSSETLKVAASAVPSMTPDAIFTAFLLEKSPHYVYTEFHQNLAATHEEKFGETPFAVIGELWMGEEAKIKHGSVWRTASYLKKLDSYLNAIPWDRDP